MSSRDQFEAWAAEHLPTLYLTKTEQGTYESTATGNFFAVWSARDGEIERLKDCLNMESAELAWSDADGREIQAERDKLKATVSDYEMGLEAAKEEIARLKAENEALRRQIPSQEEIWCACGDGYPVTSYGAGFMDANNGVCANCDAANGGVEPDLDTPDELKALRKDAERYRWICDNACDLNFYAGGINNDGAGDCRPVVGRVEIDQGQYPVDEFGSAKAALDSQIDAAMSKGEQP